MIPDKEKQEKEMKENKKQRSIKIKTNII